MSSTLDLYIYRLAKGIKMKYKLTESKEVNLYKKLLKILSNYIEANPMTGVDAMFDKAIILGKKIIPKDEKALCIIEYMLNGQSSADIVHKLFNYRLSDLPPEYKPTIKLKQKHILANWCKDGRVYDNVRSLINFEGTADTGFWSTITGEKAVLIEKE